MDVDDDGDDDDDDDYDYGDDVLVLMRRTPVITKLIIPSLHHLHW